MKIVLGIIGLLLLLLVGVSVAALTQPDHLHVERSIEIEAQAIDVAPFAEDVKKINEWSPWTELDPNISQEFSEPTSGVGAWYSWKGNDQVGSGKATITAVESGKVVTGLEFFSPMEGVAEAAISYEPKGSALSVVWSLEQDMGFVDKVFSLFMDFDAMIGPMYEKGLSKLKPLAEKAAADRRAEEERAAAEAEEKRRAEETAAAAAAGAAEEATAAE